MKTADQILKDHEDANEMHFHQVDREWIIEAMEEYAKTTRPWIKCSDQLPEEGKAVLLCHPVGYINGRFYFESMTYGIDDFIYWMPLPEPPTP